MWFIGINICNKNKTAIIGAYLREVSHLSQLRSFRSFRQSKGFSVLSRDNGLINQPYECFYEVSLIQTKIE
jgi:hypothetical protein